MKILRTLTLSLVFIAGSVTLKAASSEPTEKVFTVKDVMNTYVSAMTHGFLKNFESIVDQNAKFILLRGKTLVSFTKAEMLSFLLENQGLELGCSVNKSITTSDDDMALVKVDMVYEDFTRTNYLTIANTASGWKITEVYSVFK